jgi:EAL domain-containing protein (putative c-di-GMP-specific phosphodiesterase class I)
VLDDFGAGFASISYLRAIRFDSVKLDGSLVTAASANGAGLALLRGVLGLCEAVGVTCVAEHIETDLQLRILRDLGCRFGQGFGLARPMDSAAAFATTRSKVIPFRNIRRTAKFGS